MPLQLNEDRIRVLMSFLHEYENVLESSEFVLIQLLLNWPRIEYSCGLLMDIAMCFSQQFVIINWPELMLRWVVSLLKLMLAFKVDSDTTNDNFGSFCFRSVLRMIAVLMIRHF